VRKQPQQRQRLGESKIIVQKVNTEPCYARQIFYFLFQGIQESDVCAAQLIQFPMLNCAVQNKLDKECVKDQITRRNIHLRQIIQQLKRIQQELGHALLFSFVLGVC